MNILVLDKDPKKAGESYSDRHVLNYIITYCQFLSTAHWISLYKDIQEEIYFEKLKDMKEYLNSLHPAGSDKRPPYGIHYLNNGCTHWIVESKQNYLWLCDLLNSLCNQYTTRYGKIHKCQESLTWFKNNIPDLCSDSSLTEFYINVPESCKISENPVECYREFYIKEKKQRAKWKNGNIPEWIK